MNILLWIFQILLALHTITGAIWKFTNSEQTVPALKAIPHGVWLSMIGIELLCGAGLVLPAFSKRLGFLVPVAATCLAVEMLVFCGLYFYSGDTHSGQLIYWLVVAAVCAFIAFGRFVLKPL